MLRIAKAFGVPPCEVASWPASEVRELIVLEKIEPFGERGDYLRAGIIASTIANVNRGKDQKAFSPLDFMPKFEPTQAQAPQQIRNTLLALKASQDAILKAKEKREKARADTHRNREIRKQAQRPRAHRSPKGAR